MILHYHTVALDLQLLNILLELLFLGAAHSQTVSNTSQLFCSDCSEEKRIQISNMIQLHRPKHRHFNKKVSI